MKADWTHVTVADGTQMDVYMAKSEHPQHDLFRGSTRRPTLLVFQEAFGVNGHIRRMTERFAEMGFIAAAPDLYHRTGQRLQISYSDFSSVGPHMKALTDEGLIQDFQATAQLLQSQAEADPARMAAIGYCLGGRCAFLANTALPLKAAVSYYGGRIAPDLLPRAQDLSGPLLFFWGGKDKHITVEQRQHVMDQLNKSQKTYVNVEFSNADHGFSCDERPSYHPVATAQALALVKQFFIDSLV